MNYKLIKHVNARHCERVDDRIFETTGVNSRLLGCYNGEMCLLVHIPLSWTTSAYETALRWARIWRDQNPELQECKRVVVLIALTAPRMQSSMPAGVIARAEIKACLYSRKSTPRHHHFAIPARLISELRKGLVLRQN